MTKIHNGSIINKCCTGQKSHLWCHFIILILTRTGLHTTLTCRQMVTLFGCFNISMFLVSHFVFVSLSIHQPCKFGYSVQELFSATYNTAGYIAKHFIISVFFFRGLNSEWPRTVQQCLLLFLILWITTQNLMNMPGYSTLSITSHH